MSPSEFEDIKEEINEKQEESLKQKGVCEQIQKDWKKKYGFDTLKEAEDKLAELQEERNNKIARRDKLMDDLEEMMNED